MKRTINGSISGLLGLVLAFISIGRTAAQETQPAPSSAAQSAQQASPTDAAQPTAPSQSATATASVSKDKKGKQEYTGPTTLVELPPTPMLDEEGKQRQDPDGKLMFNPPVKQQRDKKGHPLFDAQGKPVMQTKDNLGYDENGKKLHALKEKPPKTVSVSIARGTLTVDGMTGKAALNYEIKDLKYVYFYVPGIGTAVVSNDPFPGAVEQKHAFDDKTLTVTLGEHVLQLTSDNRLLGKMPESAFVLVDKNFSVPTKFPVMGYGPIRVAPYAWPGSRNNGDLKRISRGTSPAGRLTADAASPTMSSRPDAEGRATSAAWADRASQSMCAHRDRPGDHQCESDGSSPGKHAGNEVSRDYR